MIRKNVMLVIVTFAAIGVIAVPSLAGMTSSNFIIASSVISGGAMPMGSSTLLTSTTLGQPSPINDTMASAGFRMESGFWHTIYYAAILAGDVNNDGYDDLAAGALLKVAASNHIVELIPFCLFLGFTDPGDLGNGIDCHR